MKTAQADLTTGPAGEEDLPIQHSSDLFQPAAGVIQYGGRGGGRPVRGFYSVGSGGLHHHFRVPVYRLPHRTCSGGVNVLVAHHFGADDQKNLSDTVHSAALTCAAAGLVLLGIGCGFAGGILRALNTKPELMDGAVLYLRIYCLGMPALAVYNFGNAVFSAVGDTRRPSVLPLHRRRYQCGAEPVLRHRLQYGRGGCGGGQYHLTVFLRHSGNGGAAAEP